MSQKKLTLLIPIEVRSRDLYARVYLAQKAVKLGFRVLVGKSRPLHRQLPSFPRGIIFEDEMTYQSRFFFEKASKMGYGVVSIDEEAIAITTKQRYIAQRVYFPNLEHSLLHFTRGQEDFDAIADNIPSNYKQHISKLRQAGNPRLDLLREDYFDLYAGQSPHEWNPDDVILVNSRFSRANPFDMTREQVRSVVKRKFKFSPEQYEDFCRYLDHTDKLFDAFVPIAEELPKRFPDKIIVYRPHPSENFQFWQDIADKHENAYCIHTGTAVQWAAHSRAMIHSGCTTAIESSLLGLNVIAHCPIPSDEYNVQLANNMSTIASTQEELFNLLENTTIPTPEQRISNAQKQRAFMATVAEGCLDQEACDIILENISSLNWNPPDYTLKQFIKDNLFLLRHYAWQAKAQLKVSHSSRLINQKYHAQKHSPTTKEDIQNVLKSFNALNFEVKPYKKGWWEIKAL
jgi:surface carbohydrate biosynthesis protein